MTTEPKIFTSWPFYKWFADPSLNRQITIKTMDMTNFRRVKAESPMRIHAWGLTTILRRSNI